MDIYSKEKKKEIFQSLVRQISQNKKIVNELNASGKCSIIFKASSKSETIAFDLISVVENDKDFALFVTNIYSYLFETVNSTKEFSGYLIMVPLLRTYYDHDMEVKDESYAKKMKTAHEYFRELFGSEQPQEEDWVKGQEKILNSAADNLSDLIKLATKEKDSAIPENETMQIAPRKTEESVQPPVKVFDLDTKLSEDVFSKLEWEQFFKSIDSERKSKFMKEVLRKLSEEQINDHALFNVYLFYAFLEDSQKTEIANLIYEKIMILGLPEVRALANLISKIPPYLSKSQQEKIVLKAFKDGLSSWELQDCGMVVISNFNEVIFKDAELTKGCFEFIRYILSDTGWAATAKAKNFLKENFRFIPREFKAWIIEVLNKEE